MAKARKTKANRLDQQIHVRANERMLKLWGLIVKHRKYEDELENESAVFRRMVREEAMRLGIVLPED